MRFRIRTRHDISWPLGWAAAALAVAAILTMIYSMVFDHLGNTSPDPASWVVAYFLWLGGGLAALLTLCIAPLTAPTGRGWGPALGALGIMLLGALFVLGQGGGG
jgi:cell division protein FtsW (lipid II flippase)